MYSFLISLFPYFLFFVDLPDSFSLILCFFSLHFVLKLCISPGFPCTQDSQCEFENYTFTENGFQGVCHFTFYVLHYFNT
jgi:hypothetical protein